MVKGSLRMGERICHVQRMSKEMINRPTENLGMCVCECGGGWA